MATKPERTEPLTEPDAEPDAVPDSLLTETLADLASVAPVPPAPTADPLADVRSETAAAWQHLQADGHAVPSVRQLHAVVGGSYPRVAAEVRALRQAQQGQGHAGVHAAQTRLATAQQQLEGVQGEIVQAQQVLEAIEQTVRDTELLALSGDPGAARQLPALRKQRLDTKLRLEEDLP